MSKRAATKQEALNKIYTIAGQNDSTYGRIVTAPSLIGARVRLIEIPNESQAELENTIMRMYYQEHKAVDEIIAFLIANNIPADENGIKKFLKL